MGRRGGRPGERLDVDVTEIPESEPMGFKRRREILETRAGIDPRCFSLAVGRVDKAHPVEPDQCSIRAGKRCEGVSRANHAHRTGRSLQQGLQLPSIGRLDPLCWLRDLIAGPVCPDSRVFDVLLCVRHLM